MQMLNAWLAPVRQALPSNLSPEDAQQFSQAITKEAMRRMETFLSGIRFYQNFQAEREQSADVVTVWQMGTTRLLDYAPHATGPVLFVVPSLVNRFEILDIDPDHSFLRFLVEEGFRPLVVDWQEPGEEEKSFSLADYMTQRLVPALAFVEGMNKGYPCHVLGYCMGGLMALALALLRSEHVGSLTLMATPWDFAVKGVGGVPAASTMLGKSFLEHARMWESHMEQMGYMPPEMLQSVFTSFQSLQVLHKFMRFGSGKLGAEDARRFVLTEDWLNNGVPLALPVAKECLHDWYDKNLPASLSWSVAGHRVDPRNLKMPTYIMMPTRDKIVPSESTKPLTMLINKATVHEPEIGHIGLMTGDEAPEKVWKPYVAWLRKQ